MVTRHVNIEHQSAELTSIANTGCISGINLHILHNQLSYIYSFDIP